MKEQIATIDGLEIKYLFKAQKYDTNHLVVVFSGYAGDGGEDNYDFRNMLANTAAAVLWVKDDFFNRASYYMCHELDFSIAPKVNQFILSMLAALNLSKMQTTLLGISKGGSAALFYGSEFDYPHIIACVPRFKIGSFIGGISPVRPEPLTNAVHMLGQINNQTIDTLDQVLKNSINADSNTCKHIYVFTSEDDPQYQDHILPFLGLLGKYENFNLIKARSVFIKGHSDVASYCAQAILGVVYQLSYQLTPKFINCDINGDTRDKVFEHSLEAFQHLQAIALMGKKLHLKLNGLIRGVAVPKQDTVRCKIILHNDKHQFSYDMVNLADTRASKRYYKGAIVNYTYSLYRTTLEYGVNISELPAGEYQLSLKISQGELSRQIPLTLLPDTEVKGTATRSLLRLSSHSLSIVNK